MNPETGLMGPGALLDGTWKYFRSNWLKLALVQLVPTAVFVGLGLVVGAVGMVGSLVGGGTGMAIVLIGLGLVGLVVGIYVGLWGSAAAVMAAMMAAGGETIGVKEAFRRVKGKIWAWWWVGVLGGLVILGGAMLFIVPALIMGVWFFGSSFVVLEDGGRGLEALLKSKHLVAGRWWGVAGRLFVAGLVAMGLILVAGLLQLIPILGWLVSIGMNLVLGPLMMIYIYLLYKDLGRVKAGVEYTPGKGKGWLVVLAVLGLAVPVLAILAGVALVAINPAGQLQKARQMQEQVMEPEESI